MHRWEAQFDPAAACDAVSGFVGSSAQFWSSAAPDLAPHCMANWRFEVVLCSAGYHVRLQQRVAIVAAGQGSDVVGCVD